MSRPFAPRKIRRPECRDFAAQVYLRGALLGANSANIRLRSAGAAGYLAGVRGRGGKIDPHDICGSTSSSLAFDGGLPTQTPRCTGDVGVTPVKLCELREVCGSR